MTLEVTAIAQQRLFAIWKRIRDESSQERADRVEERLLRRAEELIDQPLKGPPEPFLAELNGSHRYLLLGRYKIIYRIDGTTIHVTDFFDTKQHPSRMRG
ncbi:MAG: type II toxin-antitoxin system RelE/ParE family toxin [Flavobacteriales bacterium]|nr:type II toxin-antitoxin system RelE/ParE family toxin [Flavobacteriales bacterium]